MLARHAASLVPASVQLRTRIDPRQVLPARVLRAEGDVVAERKPALVDAGAAGQVVSAVPAVVKPRAVPPRAQEAGATRLEKVVAGQVLFVVRAVGVLAGPADEHELVEVHTGGARRLGLGESLEKRGALARGAGP